MQIRIDWQGGIQGRPFAVAPNYIVTYYYLEKNSGGNIFSKPSARLGAYLCHGGRIIDSLGAAIVDG